MAEVKFLADINLDGNQLTNIKLQHLTGDPTAAEGQIYYHSNDNVIRFHDGSNWVSLGTATGDITSVVAGDGLTGGATDGDATVNVVGGDGITANANDVAITATQTTVTSITNASLVVGRDAHNQIQFSTDNEIHFKTNNETPVIKMKASGEIEATKFDGALEGNADTATALATARTIGGTSFDGTGNISVALATLATTVTITDNESTNEENAILFSASADSDGGSLGVEQDHSGLTYNPSTGGITATLFTGAVTGNVTGDTSGSAGSVENALTFDNTTVQLNSGTTYNGSAARTVSAKTAAIANAGTALATADQIHTFVTGQTDAIAANTSGSSATVTSIGNLTGDVTSSNRATTIAADAVHHSMLSDDIISGQGALTSGLASTDEFMISDAGTVKKMDVSVLQTYLQSGLTFTTNTDTDVSVANLKTALAGGFGSNAVTIGDSDDVVTIGNDLTVTGDLLVSGDTVTVNTSTLSVEDPLIFMANGNGADSVDVGFYAKYTATGAKYTGLFRDASDSNTWKLFATSGNSHAAPSTTVDTSSGFTYGHLNLGNLTSNGTITGDVTGDVTGDLTGNAATVTTNANLTGDVTSSGNATTIAADAVHHSMLSEDIITGQAAITALEQDDIFMVNDTSASAVKKITYSNLEDDIFGNISTDITVAAGGAATIATAAVTLAKMANLAADKIVGRANGAGTGVPTALTATQVRTIINVENGSTADQSKSDIDGLAITTVGTLDTGNATAIVDAASASAAGKVELATTAEALAGTDTSRAVTAAGLAARSYRTAIGDTSATAIAVTHSLGTRDVVVQMYDASSYETVYAQVVRTDANTVTITFNTAPGSSDVIVMVSKID